MPIYKGKTSKDILLPFNASDATLSSVNIVNKHTDTNFITLFIRDNKNYNEICISAAPIKLKQGEAYIRDSALKIYGGHQFFITVTGPIDYYIVTTP